MADQPKTLSNVAERALSLLRDQCDVAFALESRARSVGLLDRDVEELKAAWANADRLCEQILQAEPHTHDDRAARVEARLWLDGDLGVDVGGVSRPIPGTLAGVNVSCFLEGLETEAEIDAIRRVAVKLAFTCEDPCLSAESEAVAYVVEELGRFARRLEAEASARARRLWPAPSEDNAHLFSRASES